MCFSPAVISEGIGLLAAIIIMLGVAVFGIFTNRNIGFYSLAAFLIFEFVLNCVMTFRLFVMLAAIFGGGNYDRITVYLSVAMILICIAAYCVALKTVAFDKDVSAWRSFRRYRH